MTQDVPRAGRDFRQAVAGNLGVLAEETGNMREALGRIEHEQGQGRLGVVAVGKVLARSLDEVGTKLDALAADHDVEANAFAGMVVTRRVVLNLKSGSAITGLVVRHAGPLLEVAEAVLLQEGADPRPVDGRVVVERVAVEFVQVLS